jgi:alpha-beta hydrolase superfamily lysophospholipase
MLKHRYRAGALAVGIAGLLAPLALMARAPQAKPDPAMTAVIAQVRREIGPLDLTTDEAPSPATLTYFDYYALNPEGISHAFGTVPSGKEQLAVHVLRPEQPPRGTVLLVHGYFDHVGTWRHIITDLLEAGYTVVAFDMPGHGLATGKRADIEDFASYSQALHDILPIARTLDAPLHIVAHSTGCSAVIDYLLIRREPLVPRIVLISPLIRSYAWIASGLGEALIGGVVDSVPRVLRKNSADEEFFTFMQRDPLQHRAVPLGWVEAQGKWATRIEEAVPSTQRLRVIQGTGDTTVSWRHNLRVLTRKFPNAEIIKVKKGGHQLHNEAEPLRGAVLRHVREWLTGTAQSRQP